MFHLLATSVHIPRDNNQDEFPHNGKQDIYDTAAMQKAKRDLLLGHCSPVSPHLASQDRTGHPDISTFEAVGMESDPSQSVPFGVI